MSSLEEKKSELERVLGVFQNYIEGSELLDVVYSKKFGYVWLCPEGAGTGRVHSSQSAAGQQRQDRGCGVCHLRDAPSPGHGPAV